ncbi:putative tropinone reductase I [Medicago truncatula]|uniref:Putative tropinone reductase I n=1 Tax=Medicago truncatula TaxID=3880 RepID=A0A396I894_MEDTR|nr:putative tropinone reductase I [Medicago truncatula]
MIKMAEGNTSSRSSKWSLKGTTALVTGGSKGIGLLYFVLLLFFRQIN